MKSYSRKSSQEIQQLKSWQMSLILSLMGSLVMTYPTNFEFIQMLNIFLFTINKLYKFIKVFMKIKTIINKIFKDIDSKFYLVKDPNIIKKMIIIIIFKKFKNAFHFIKIQI